MSRLVARAESFERIYDAFDNINFAAFDYDTVKQSLLDYIKLYFPETFNDFIESSEFIALIETFAYIAEQMAYRLDINSHENFISTAQRKDSILRLAKLVSYTAARPLPARGLVKITSVSTTESIIDATGLDLANRKITWNDVSNPTWKDQFMLIMNRAMEQPFGTVGPTDRFQLQDVLFEMYSWNLSPLPTGVFSYSALASGTTAKMELVPVEHDDQLGIIERRPQNNTNFTFLYGQDGLGDASPTTGFFCYTKQGSLQRIRTSFDGITPNQTFEVPVTNVNDTDVWVNNVDPSTGEILDIASTLPYRHETLAGKSGEWVQVDLAHAQNVIFNTNPKRNKYEVETLDNSRIRLIFGDGEFADVPSGTFDVWVRSSLDQDIVVSQSSVSNVTSSFTYVDAFNRTQTFTFTFSLISTLQNASASEDIEHVRATAPAVYYAQDRMVNGEDYNVFMLQDPSILKLRAINRTFAGDSKYINWHDATGTYENVKIFGNDGAIYYQNKTISAATPSVSLNQLIKLYIEPVLSSTDMYTQLLSNPEVDITVFRRTFNTDEQTRIADALTAPPLPVQANIYYRLHNNPVTINNPGGLPEWYAVKRSDLDSFGNPPLVGWPADYITTPLITVDQTSTQDTRYSVAWEARHIVFESQTTSFWNTNEANKVIEYDTLDSNRDNIIVLQANTNATRDGILTSDWMLDVLGQEINDSGVDIALPDIHRLSVLPADTNNDGAPDNMALVSLINPEITVASTGTLTLGTVTPGTGYTAGTYTSVPLTGGTGTRATADITFSNSVIDTIGSLVGGTLYTDGTYTNVALTGGTGTGATADITISGGSVTAVTLVNHGIGYTVSDILSADALNIGNTGSGFTVTILTVTTGALSITIVQSGQGYTIGDVLSVDPNSVGCAGTGFFVPITAIGSVTLTLPLYYIGANVVDADGYGGDITRVSGVGTIVQTPANTISNQITVTGATTIRIKEYVYFVRETTIDAWVPAATTPESMAAYIADQIALTSLWKREEGRSNVNFAWLHRSSFYHLIDPSPTNIIDMFIITKGYYTSLKRWLENPQVVQPTAPTPLDLRTSYNYLLDNRMISDTVVLHPGTIKLLFGPKAAPQLQATFKVVRSPNATLTNNQIKTKIVSTIRNFFDLSYWEFGETFYFSELSAAIHTVLTTEISSIVLVPTFAQNQFGDLYQIKAREDEVFYPDVSVDNVEIVESYTSTNLRFVPA